MVCLCVCVCPSVGNTLLFSRGHATLNLAVSVRPSVGHISELRAVFALLLLPNRPQLDCHVSGLVTDVGNVQI